MTHVNEYYPYEDEADARSAFHDFLDETHPTYEIVDSIALPHEIAQLDPTAYRTAFNDFVDMMSRE